MQNPNPLTYCKSIIEFGQPDPVFRAWQKYQVHQKKSLKLIPKLCAPSIPKRQQLPENMTGKEGDSAGPGNYETNVSPIKQQSR